MPLDADHIRLYVCGPTVYDLAHVGNARGMTVFDVLVRLLRHLYPRVTYVRNITDVDDKINARAAESGQSIAEITAGTGAQFAADMAALGNTPPDIEPRATQHVAEMLVLIERLIASGHAYAADGHVLFAVPSYPGYGALSGRTPDELLAGARVDVAPYKRDAGDFVLWKPSPTNSPLGQPLGPRPPGLAHRVLRHVLALPRRDLRHPWRRRRPDLPAPRERAGPEPLRPPRQRLRPDLVAQRMLLSEGEKMSKSRGNFTTIKDALSRAPAEALRMALLRAQYRSTLEFGAAAMAEARGELDRFYRALQRTPAAPGPVPDAVLEALCDDLNTPAAFAAMHALADKAMAGDAAAAAGLQAAGALLGLLRQSPAEWFQGGADAGAIEAAIAERIAARRARDFARADAIRAEYLAQGIAFEDRPDGTTLWRRTADPA